jgi:hypothetical protein
MPKLLEEILDNYKKVTGKEAKIHSTLGTQGKYLLKHSKESILIDKYRSLVGNIMYYTTKWNHC